MIENSKIEYKLQINLPELGSQDSFNIVIDLDSKPGLSSVIGNFYRFLMRIGVDKELLDDYIIIPEEGYSTSGEDEVDWNDATSQILTEIEKSILENSSDEKKKEEFLKRIQENPDFLEEVFRIFLNSIMEDNSDEV